jgi:hypothetical protein
MVLECIKMEGSLFIFNSTLVGQYKSDSIIYFLRVKYGLTKDELKDGINHLKKHLFFDDETLDKGLDHLQSLGLLTYNSKDHEYQLTSRGYMYW